MNLYLQYNICYAESIHDSRDLGLTHVGEEIKRKEMGHGQKLGFSALASLIKKQQCSGSSACSLYGVEQGGTAIVYSSIKEAGLWSVVASRRQF